MCQYFYFSTKHILWVQSTVNLVTIAFVPKNVAIKMNLLLYRILNEQNGMEAGLPQSGKKVWKTKFFPGQGKVIEVCFESGKLAEIGKSQGKVREFQNFVKTEMSMAVVLIFRN